MKDQFTKKGLVHVGRGTYWVGFNMPGTITIAPDRIQVRCWGKTYVFARDEIHQIRRFRALATLVQIVHKKPGYPRFIAFWTPMLGTVWSALQRYGY